ncbi:MAG: phage holin family protein [Candidatus Eremiobacteraeota bacterium]|nr:phage holin family protein [Candidatus Eremiobacteraeota bacterium]MBV9646000.1 phage holin family protein [Candidatus Eremiobacteraeota bacterium]
MNWLIRFVINAIALYLIAKFVPGFNHDVGVVTALIAAIIFGLVNAIIGPILRLVTLPINWITHGVFSIVVNYILFWLTVLIAPNFKTTGEIPAWEALLIGAIIMMIVSTAVHAASRTEEERAAAR